MKNPLWPLFETLDRRDRPEDAAMLVRDYLRSTNSLSKQDEQIFSRVIGKNRNTVSYMSNNFRKTNSMDSQIKVAKLLFKGKIPEHLDNVKEIDAYLEKISRQIRKQRTNNNFESGRFNRDLREEHGLGDMSKRRYNKLFRLLIRMESKAVRLGSSWQKRGYEMMAKSGLAHKITWDEFREDPAAACFVVYYLSKCNRRSLFTAGSQDRPMDGLADFLLRRLGSKSSWWVVAHIMPTTEVLSHLSDKQKGKLLATHYKEMNGLARFMEKVWSENSINRGTMIVKRGDDSSTWNAVAGTWNKCRDAWMSLLYSMGLESWLDSYCPGKAMRLIAGDVAYWHSQTGDDYVDPQVKVWAKLHLPWKVMVHDEVCLKEDVLKACKDVGIDAIKSGWIAPKPKQKVHAFTATPELVHGVVVESPELAEHLRKLGVFSGKNSNQAIDVDTSLDVEKVRTKHAIVQEAKKK